VFSIVSARERRWFWATLPSKTLIAALVADALLGTALTFAGLPDLKPLPVAQMFAILVFSMVSCLVVNDALKVALMRWRVPHAATAIASGTA
jgi:H+-transporting ATPase